MTSSGPVEFGLFIARYKLTLSWLKTICFDLKVITWVENHLLWFKSNFLDISFVELKCNGFSSLKFLRSKSLYFCWHSINYSNLHWLRYPTISFTICFNTVKKLMVSTGLWWNLRHWVVLITLTHGAILLNKFCLIQD